MAAAAPAPSKRIWRRLIAALAVLIALNATAGLWGDRYIRWLLPLYQWSFESLTPHYRVQSLRIEQEGGERFVKLRVKTAGVRRIGGQWVPSDIAATSSTLAGHALQHVIVLFTLIFAWPVRSRWERGVLVALAVPVLLVIEALDIPLVLAGALEDSLLYYLAPDRLSTSLLVQGMHLMNGGGRLALSLIGAALTIALWHAARPTRSRTDH